MLVGENGAGKSTFLKVLLGLYPDFTGKLYRNGAVSRTGIGKNVFALLQDYRLYPATVAENVLLRECKKEDEMTVWEALRKQIRTADTGSHYLHQQVVRARNGLFHLAQLY